MKKHFRFYDCGNIVQVLPLTKKANLWLRENCHFEAWQKFGTSLCVDYRYFDTIYLAIKSDF